MSQRAPHGFGKHAKALFGSLGSVCDKVEAVKSIFYKDDGSINPWVPLNERYKAQRLITEIRRQLTDLDVANDEMIKANNMQRQYQLERAHSQ